MLISREREKKMLLDALRAEEAQFIAVYGRRRVGKTYLIRQTYGNMLTFEHSGLANGGRKEQIQAFTSSIRRAGLKVDVMPTNWLDAFELLKDLVEKSSRNKKVLFIDELSWMDTQKSGFLVALENFWNGWASARKDVVLVVCASATSWMLDKIIHNKGGLYNRLSGQIYLRPFKLCECEEYLKSKGISISRYDILEMFMAIGGIPYYWSLMKKGRSVAQNIDEMFFADDAPLKDEFKYLYASLFKNPQNYIDIVTVLAKKKKGLLRNEIAEETGVPNSGYLTKILDELISCDFIRKYTILGKKTKDALYQLTDFYTIFYFQFLQKKKVDEHYWAIKTDTSVRNTWCGLAFERVCFDHINEIKAGLGISGVLTEVHSWATRADKASDVKGAQIDMVIVRNDRIINLCEMKYSISEYSYTGKDEESLRNKIVSLKTLSKTKHSIHPILVTTYGLKDGIYSGRIQAVITANDLFMKN
ncbi:MAG: ATP-binding protein [Lachnospiraceae bacterium]|nr:ATP-binding protein [Lachnospiraceae bacterium]